MRLDEWQEADFKPHTKLGKKSELGTLWYSMQNETPAYPGVYGKWQAVCFDFSHMGQLATSGSPAILAMAGGPAKPSADGGSKASAKPKKKSKTPQFDKLVKQGIIDLSRARLTHPKYAGKGVHCPKMRGELSMAQRVVGEGEAEMADVVAEWFKDRLDSPHARAPVPEIWPAMRLVDGPTEVSIVVPEEYVLTIPPTDQYQPIIRRSTSSPLPSRRIFVQASA